jgi:cytochrome b pre-mRNA-processing protein 3
MPIWPFQRSREAQQAESLLAVVTEISRTTGFYGPGRAADTLEGRFELMTLFGALALIRLRSAPEMASLAQHFTDVLFRQFDAGLREDGVGDLAVPKRMHKLAGAFYGRLNVYAEALRAPDAAALEQAIGRNVLGDNAAPFAAALAARVVSVARQLGMAPVDALFQPEAWTV